MPVTHFVKKKTKKKIKNTRSTNIRTHLFSHYTCRHRPMLLHSALAVGQCCCSFIAIERKTCTIGFCYLPQVASATAQSNVSQKCTLVLFSTYVPHRHTLNKFK